MRKIKIIILLFLFYLSFFYSPLKTYAESNTVFLGGYPAGFTLYQRGACVVGLCDVVCGENIYSPSKDAGIEIGDIILYIEDNEVNNSNDIFENVKDGREKIITIQRNEVKIIKKIKPQKDNLGTYKLGLFIKEGINGIGTITFFTKDRICCLGHPVLNDDNVVFELSSGNIFECSITGAIKGVRGRPGELRGVFNDEKLMGNIDKNNSYGVFGEVLNCGYKLKEIQTGVPCMGDAYIYSTIEGQIPKKYSISIVKVDNLKDEKNIVIKINDKELLEKTNGIVQGMSGSPIVQNGKLVGAVTHVFINDPTRGFGVSIDKMINNL